MRRHRNVPAPPEQQTQISTEVKITTNWTAEEATFVASYVYMRLALKGTLHNPNGLWTFEYIMPWDDLRIFRDVFTSAGKLVDNKRGLDHQTEYGGAP